MSSISQNDLHRVVQELADKAAIQDLFAAYAQAVDERDFEAWQALFTEDGGYGPPGFRVPKHLLVEAGERLLERFERTQHLLGQHIVMIDGDTAEGRCYFTAYHLENTTVESTRANLGGWYLNSYRRTADGWRIANVTGEIVWLEGRDYMAESIPIWTEVIERGAATA